MSFIRNLKLGAAVIAAVLALPDLAQPIGRSGNGRISSAVDGFTTESPKYFELSEPLPNDGLRIAAPGVRTSWTSATPLIELRRFIVEFPEANGLNRHDVRNQFAARGWWLAQHSDPCVELFLSDNETASSAVATWGESKGVVIIGAKNSFTKASIKALLDSLVVDPGACSWK